MTIHPADRGYTQIAGAEFDGELLAVRFANGDVVQVAPASAFGEPADSVDWSTIRWDEDHVSVETATGTAELPWDSVRALTDPAFVEEMVAEAEAQARRIGVRLRALRESRGLSSKEVARRAGISPQSMSRIELGRHDVVFTTLEKILAAMGCRLRDLAVADEPGGPSSSGYHDSGTEQVESRPDRRPQEANDDTRNGRLETKAGSSAFERAGDDINELDHLVGIDFARALGRLLETRGYSEVRTTPDEGDFGAHLLAIKDGLKYAVHTKRAMAAVGIPSLRQALGGMSYWDAARGLVITNSFFSAAARELANESQLDLVDRSDLIGWLSNAPLRSTGGITPRPHQAEALANLRALRRRNEQRALVVMASGLGKTYVAALDAWQYQDELGRRPRVLYISHQAVILQQARLGFERVFGATRTYGHFDADRRELDRDVLFATFQSIYRSLDRVDPTAFDYVVVDEAHHTAAPTRDAVVQHLEPRFMLGLTATPFRGDGRDISAYYGDVLAASIPLERAVAHGLLAPIDYRVVSDRVDETALATTLRAANGNGSTNGHLFDPLPDEVIVDTVMSEAALVDDRRKVLVFCSTLAQMDHFAGKFPRSRTISGRDSRRQQIATIEDLHAGDFEVLLSRDVLNEGIDIPDAATLVFLRNTESPTIFLQQLGRGLRRTDGKDRVGVFDFVNTLTRIESVYKFFSRLESEQSAHRARSRETSGTQSSLALDDTARAVVSALLRKKRQSGLVVDLDSIGGALDDKLSGATLRRFVGTGRLVPDFVMPGSGAHTAIYFETPTVRRFMRQVQSPHYLGDLLPERDFARLIGKPISWVRNEQRRGSLPAAWVHRRPSGKIELYFEPADAQVAEVASRADN